MINGSGAGVARVLPRGEDFVPRELKRLGRQQQQGVASTAKTVAALQQTVVELQQAVTDIQALINEQVAYRSVGVSQANFLVDGTPTPRASGAITVPDGYTQATILAIANGGAVNTRDAIDYLHIRAVINGVGGGSTPNMMTPGGYATGVGTAIRSLTVTGGAAITVAAYVTSEGGSWGTSAANGVHVDAVAWFTRS